MPKMKTGRRKFYAEHSDQMKKFFMKAQQMYASGAVKPQVDEEAGSSMIKIEDGKWAYSDLWYGGEPYSGITTLYCNGVACWSMVYWGRILPNAKDKQRVLTSLMDALQHNHSVDQPWRGPQKFRTSTGLHYTNECKGGMLQFSGKELITRRLNGGRDEPLYQMSYMGGVVNQD